MTRKFYCSLDTLETIVFNPKDNIELGALLPHHSQIMLDVPGDQIGQVEDDLDNPESSLAMLIRQAGYVIVPQADCFNDMEALLRKEASGALFVLDKEPAECEKLSRKFGVCAVSLTQAQATETLTAHYYRQIEKGNNYSRERGGQMLTGWRDLLAEKPFIPLNALVIIDNFLLKTEAKGQKSIINLLDALLPANLDKHLIFEVLVVVSAKEYPIKPEVLDRVAAGVEASLKRPYSIKVGILTHNGEGRFHRRVVISNHHFLRSDRGFAHFTDAKADDPNDLTLNGAFHDLTRPGNHLMWQSMAVDLRSVKSLWLDNKRLKENGRDAIITTNRMQGHCDNRLLNLVP